jgi:hypothetical protein
MENWGPVFRSERSRCAVRICCGVGAVDTGAVRDDIVVDGEAGVGVRVAIAWRCALRR